MDTREEGMQGSTAPRKRRADRTRAVLMEEEARQTEQPVRTARRAERTRAAMAQEEAQLQTEAAAPADRWTHQEEAYAAQPTQMEREIAPMTRAAAPVASRTASAKQEAYRTPQSAPQQRRTASQRDSSAQVNAVSARSMAALRNAPMRTAPAHDAPTVEASAPQTRKVETAKRDRNPANDSAWGAATLPTPASTPSKKRVKSDARQEKIIGKEERNSYGVPRNVQQEKLGSQAWLDMPRQANASTGQGLENRQVYAPYGAQTVDYGQNNYAPRDAYGQEYNPQNAYAQGVYSQNAYPQDGGAVGWNQPADMNGGNAYGAYGAYAAPAGYYAGQEGASAGTEYAYASGYGEAPVVGTGDASGGGTPPSNGKKHHFGRVAIIGAVALLLLGGAGVGGSYALRYYAAVNAVSPYDNVFCQGVYVDGLSLGGMTPETAMQAVQQQSEKRSASWSVRLTYNGQVAAEITANQLGMSVDFAEVMNEAWRQGHTGDIYERNAAQQTLLETPYEAYTAMPSGNTSVVDTILEELKNNVYRAAQDAKVLSFDPTLTYPFTFEEEVQGRVLDVTALKDTIYRMVSTLESGEVEITPDAINPSVTVADLKQNLSLRSSVYTPIDKHSTENRTNNIRRCFEKISGFVLSPNSKFSFNTVVGKRTLDNGFFEAVEYAYGEHVMGVGGGACQASTTLYQAAVEANLKINTRKPHSDSVSYASYGEDATVYWTTGRKIDLAFTNNTDHDLYFVATVDTDPSNSSRLIARVSIYGESVEPGVRYELQSETIQELDPPSDPEYVKDKNAEHVTYTDQQYAYSKAKKGYVVESYRVKYVNEQVAERVLLYTDTYKAKAAVIYVGVTKRE